MPSSLTAGYYRAHYAPIQHAKYAQAWPQLAPLLQPAPSSLLDVGIGPAWFETFLSEQGITIPRLVGVDIDEAAIQPATPHVTYILDPAFQTPETFDFVVCWDAYHVLENKRLFDFVKPGGLLLVSAPPAFEKKLYPLLKTYGPILDMKVGDIEKSRVLVWRKNST